MESFREYLVPLKSQLPSMTELLIKWASINSGSENIEGLKEMLEVIRGDFASLPGSHECIALSDSYDVQALKISCRREAPVQVLLCGHIDTVYGIDHPFQECTRISENILRGPGVTDMKGGLIVMLYALKSLELAPFAKNIGWTVLLTPDEEVGSHKSMQEYEAQAKLNTVGLIFEPCLPNGNLVGSRKGYGKYWITVHGQAAHSGRNFESGRNAILHLIQILLNINALNEKYTHTTFNIAKIEGGGPLNVIPDKAVGYVSIRTIDEEINDIQPEIDSIIHQANQVEGYSVACEGGFSRPPKPLTPQVEFLLKEYKQCSEDLGYEINWENTGGGTDGNNLYYFGLPNLDSLGVKGNYIHSDQEFIYLDSLVERAELTGLFLLKLASGNIILTKDLF